MRTIDKASRVPFYAQLADLLERTIRDDGLAAGDRLPSEAQLCHRYDVSRTVVRQALAELESHGLIDRYKGRGSFVAPPKVDEHLAQTMTGLAEEVQARGQRLDNQIRVFELQEPSAHVAEMLDLQPGISVVRLDRLRRVNGEPWVFTSTFLPADLCEGLLAFDMRHRSLYATLEQELGIVLERGRRTIEAALAGEEHGEQLGVHPGAPVLVLRSRGYAASGRIVEYFIAWHRGDRSRFDVEVRRRPPG